MKWARTISRSLLLALAACTPLPPPDADAPFSAPDEPRLLIHFQHLPQPAWALEARTESGLVRRRDGVGDRAELFVPPGPVMLCLRSGGKDFYLPHSVGPVTGQVLVWDVTAR